jgi:hypothetical protein
MKITVVATRGKSLQQAKVESESFLVKKKGW